MAMVDSREVHIEVVAFHQEWLRGHFIWIAKLPEDLTCLSDERSRSFSGQSQWDEFVL